MMQMGNPLDDGTLEHVRVLDLADEKGVYCGKLLADLGADVIKIEPPGGDATRKRGPSFNDEPHPERSLFWFHFNTNKRSITLNLSNPEGREILKKLAKTADIMVESFPPGYLEHLGLDYSTLKRINPGLILTSITGFGQTGPWKDFKTCDLVAQALGGPMYECGWPDLPPAQIAGLQAYHQVSSQAAMGTLIALYYRITSGEGQQVDVSMHESMPISHMNGVPHYMNTGDVYSRIGDEHNDAATGIFACRDGYVDFRFSWRQRWDALVEWLCSEGMADDLGEEIYRDREYRRQEEVVVHIDNVFRQFLRTHTKMEIYEEGQRRGFLVNPVNNAKDVANDPQLVARNFFVSVEHSDLGMSLSYLGTPYRLSKTPWRIRRRAPRVGEHNAEIYEKELGFSKGEMISLKQASII